MLYIYKADAFIQNDCTTVQDDSQLVGRGALAQGHLDTQLGRSRASNQRPPGYKATGQCSPYTSKNKYN